MKKGCTDDLPGRVTFFERQSHPPNRRKTWPSLVSGATHDVQRKIR